MIRLTIILLLFGSGICDAQKILVPDQMEFAGIRLKIKEEARREIQEEVNALNQNEKYFLNKLSRVIEYFPIIERIFAEEDLPDDFKYLIIQESAFVPDAVSSSNAVGYWQFKAETALEVGMRIDTKIDERMHIIPSTRGAARYLQKNNYFFNNWLNALQAYQMGAGGALEVLGDRDSGAKSMTIDKHTYWYVKKYLAHKIAFEEGLKLYRPEAKSLVEYTRGAGKTLREISREVDVEETVLESYNRWLKVKKVPSDADYIVIIPLTRVDNIQTIAQKQNIIAPDFDQVQQTSYPAVVNTDTGKPFLVMVNSLKGILAARGSTLASLAQQGEISVKELVKYNELKPGQKIVEDQIYYLEKKHTRGKIYFHTVEAGETLWSISQKYGIRESRIAAFNRIDPKAQPAEGLILWLHRKRPSSVQAKFREPGKEEQLKIIAGKTEARDLASAQEIFQREVVKIEENVNFDSLNLKSGNRQDDFVPETDSPEDNFSGQRQVVENGEPVATFTPAESEPTTEKSEISRADSYVVHTVIQGETLFSISRKYGISVEELRNWNSIDDANTLKMDQELKIMQKNDHLEDDSGKTYTKHKVIAGDTLYRISKIYNVSLNDLLKWNNKNSSELKIGETLLIKK